MSCYHLYDCPRCGGQAESLSNALYEAIQIIRILDKDNKDIQELESVLREDGVDFSE